MEIRTGMDLQMPGASGIAAKNAERDTLLRRRIKDTRNEFGSWQFGCKQMA